MRILFFTREPHPTHRADVAALFGKYLPRLGIGSDIVAMDARCGQPAAASWPPGVAITCRSGGSRTLNVLRAFLHGMRALAGLRAGKYDAVLVRDNPLLATIARLASWRARIPCYYWSSFPVAEGYRELARLGWKRIGLARWAFNHAKALGGSFLLYRIVLRRADHAFVQSEYMRQEFGRRGVPVDRMTAVPMGVDMEEIERLPAPFDDPRLAGRMVVVQVGSFDPSRRLDVLLEAFALARRDRPELLLVMVGAAKHLAEEGRLRHLAERLGIGRDVVWTGWLPMTEAWQYARAASVGVSLIPRSDLYDCASPTKVSEYLALGVPALVNDLPDQVVVARESRAALVAPFHAEGIANRLVSLLDDPELRRRMSAAGPAYIAANRSYEVIAGRVAERLRGDRHASAVASTAGGRQAEAT